MAPPGVRIPATASPASTASSEMTPAGSSEVSEVKAAFDALAAALAPMPVYGITRPPDGARLAGEWWPVTQVSSPGEYAGANRANPHLAGLGSEQPQGEMLLSTGSGWLDVVENFRGDLGETQATEVGKVAGHVAILCHANGGTLVQWSDGGRWYGVFGRGVADEVVVDAALGAQLVGPNKVE